MIMHSPIKKAVHALLFTSAICIAPISAGAQSCDQVNKGIAGISKEIRDMQVEGASDNSAPRATMRAARMTFGAQAQSNLMSYGRALGCKFSGLNLPTSIQGGDDAQSGKGGL